MTTTLLIRIDTDNSAFEYRPVDEIGRILGGLLSRIESGKRSGMLMDKNGNTVGDFTWTGTHAR